jgi:hypothetical protein
LQGFGGMTGNMKCCALFQKITRTAIDTLSIILHIKSFPSTAEDKKQPSKLQKNCGLRPERYL